MHLLSMAQSQLGFVDSLLLTSVRTVVDSDWAPFLLSFGLLGLERVPTVLSWHHGTDFEKEMQGRNSVFFSYLVPFSKHLLVEGNPSEPKFNLKTKINHIKNTAIH